MNFFNEIFILYLFSAKFFIENNRPFLNLECASNAFHSIINTIIAQNLVKTSLKIFKHYKLKPSFSIIKDNKAKDRAGVGDKPPHPNFGRSINANLIQFLFFHPIGCLKINKN
jgi:hypothetical protein